jgi:membrane-bound lytic murein transglycosylase D
VEKRISMKLIHFVSLASLIWLTGCATTSQPRTEPTTTTTASQATATVAVPVIVAPPPPPHVAVFPDGPMQPIAEARTSSQSVARLLPPADLWERIRRGFAMPNLNNDLVQSQEQWYSTRPEYIQRMTERSRKYLFHIVEELERRNMPSELALLPFIESAFNPQAVSSAKAAGMWQFIPSTGRSFDLKQNVFRDDRRDVLASTRAALDYLQKLHGMFGDWHLALASYNWGEGSVGRAIAKNQKAGLGTAYTDLHMPNETRNYVPKLQAVKNIVANPDNFRATLPLIDNHPYFQSVDITRDIDVELAARLADVNIEDFKALNPSANRPVILAAGTPQILLPWDNANVFRRNFAALQSGQYASWTAWTAPSTMSAAAAAQRVGMSENDFRAVNNIPPRMLIRAGSTVLVPRTATMRSDVTEHVADNAQMSLSPEVSSRRTVIKAGKRDTVASIAKRYRLSPQSVADWNDVAASTVFAAGQKVVVYLPVRVRNSKSTSKRAVRPVAPRAAKRASKK